MYLEDKKQSVEAYKKSLEINPKNQNASEKIRNMDGYVAGISQETRTPAKYKTGENTGIIALYFGEEPAFSEGYVDYSPFITLDENKLIFNRIFRDKNGVKTGGGTYYLQKTQKGRGKPAKFQWQGMFFSSTEDGTLYTTITPLGIGIYEPSENGYKGPTMLRGGVQLADHVFVARDGSYIVLDSEDIEGYGSEDLFICFRMKSGIRGRPVNLVPEINGPAGQAMACISPDNKYLFFSSNRDIYWVNIKYLDRFIKSRNN